MLGNFKIRHIQAKPSEKTYGYIRVYESPTYIANMPVGIVYGSEPGPILCLTGSVHGGLMYAGVEAIVRTWEKIDPQKLKGVLLTVSVVDVPSFDSRTPDKSPIDALIVSNCFPGNPDGTVSEVIAHILLNEVIAKSDFHVDLRSGNIDEMLTDFTVYCKTGNAELDAKKARLAGAYGTDVILLTTEAELTDQGNLIKEAAKRGVTSIIASVGIGMARADERDISEHMAGIENVMKYLKMLEGAPNPRTVKPKLEIQPAYMVHAKHAGLFYPKVELGAVVPSGELVGEIKNAARETLEEVFASVDGIVHAVSARRSVIEGEKLVTIRRLFDKWMDQFVKEWLDRFLED